MPVAYKALGQVAPSATTDTTLYTVPSSPTTQVVVSTISICNRGATAGTYRIALRPNGATIANLHYIAYDATLAANSTDVFTIGLTCDSADVITVYASNANFTFAAFGTEIT